MAAADKETVLAARAFGVSVEVGENGRAIAVELVPQGLGDPGWDADWDTVLECVSRLSDLERFDCTAARHPFTDEGLAHLGKLKKLKWAEISSDEITDDGLKVLTGMDKLESLTLRGEKSAGQD